MSEQAHLKYALALAHSCKTDIRYSTKFYVPDKNPFDLWQNSVKSNHWDEVARDLEWAQQPGHHIVSCWDSDYPALLREIAAPPLVLYIVGDRTVLSAPQVAIVGSRQPTSDGLRTAGEFASHLATAGLVITSGLAYGIDAAGHQGAIAARGRTIAVLAHGLDRLYPRSHHSLAEMIGQTGGALVSEFPLGVGPAPAHFPWRNRIISGLALGLLVVEAALKSGSLITARLALEQGREIFAIPGSIRQEQTRGCHYLIREGANLVETPEEVMLALQPLMNTVR